MIKWIYSLFFLLVSTQLWSAEKTYRERLYLNDSVVEIKIIDFINERNQREMKFVTDNLAEFVLGFARDIDRDGSVETFFVFGKNGLTSVVNEKPRTTSIERAREVLRTHAQYSGRDYFSSIAENISSFLFFGVDHLVKAQETYFRDWMDLTELSLLLERTKSQLSRDEYIYGLNLVMEANALAYERLDKAIGSGQAIHWAGDVGMWLSGAVLLKWAARTLRAPIRGAGLGLKITLKTYQKTVHKSLQALSVKSVMSRSGKAMMKGLKNIKTEWKYITASMAAQGTAEVFAYYDEVKDPNPATVALNLLHHPEVKENVSISLVDSMLMTGAYGVGQTKLARFALIGTVGVVSSYAVGVGLSGNQSNERLLFDSAWGLGVDALQTMVELNVLHRFHEAALKSRKPHLKIVGYAIVFVSQVASYYAYSRAAQYVDPSKDLEEGQIQMVPILANN